MKYIYLPHGGMQSVLKYWVFLILLTTFVSIVSVSSVLLYFNKLKKVVLHEKEEYYSVCKKQEPFLISNIIS